jgi:hypothetical protein
MSKNPFQNFMVRYPAGQPVYAEGEEGATMYIVHSGRVRLFREVEGQQHGLGAMEKGDFFGEMAILEGLPRTHSAEAQEACELVEINSMTFDKMIRGNIEIAIRMLRKLSIRLREAERKIAEFQVGGVRAVSLPAAAAAAAAQPRGPVPSGARLELDAGAAVFSVTGHEIMLGRYDPVTEQKPDIDLTDLDLKRSVSRRHARIIRSADGYAVLEEVGALNGTFVNGTKLVTGQPHPLLDGDSLSLGTVTMVFRN